MTAQRERQSPTRWPNAAFVLEGSWIALGGLTVLSLITALCEAVLLGAVAQSAAALSAGDSSVNFEAGLVSLSIAVTTLLAAATVAAIVRALLTVVISMWGPVIAGHSRERQRNRLLGSYLNADWQRQAGDRSGQLIQTFSTSVNESSTVLVNLSAALPAGVTLAVLVTFALLIDPLVAGVVGALGVVLALMQRPLSEGAKAAAQVDRIGRDDAASIVSSVVSAGAELAVAGGGSGVGELTAARVARSERARARAQGLKRVTATSSQSFAFVLAAAGLLFVALRRADVDFVAIGTVAILLLRAAGLLQQLQTLVNQFGVVAPFIEQVRTTIDRYERHVRSWGANAFPDEADVRLRDVVFSYPGRAEPDLVIDELVFGHGSASAVVGPSGSGKSTLAQLVLRLRSADRGEVSIGETGLGRISEAEWTENVAYVPQSAHILPVSIMENIRFFRSHITDQQVFEAARRAQIYDVLAGLEDGFETVVDSHVDSLSGGQKQRLSLARAICSNPSLLVLDEPTSALDSDSELAVLDMLRELRGSTTIIMITHRVTALEMFDQVVRISDGRLVQ